LHSWRILRNADSEKALSGQKIPRISWIGVQGIVKAMQLMLEDGLTIPQVDALFGPALGRPKTAMFKTSDLVGLDTMAHVSDNTYDMVADDEQRDSFIIPEFVKKMIANKLLGDKTKGGFYKKEKSPEGKTIRKVINPLTLAYAEYGKADFPCLSEAKSAKKPADKIKAVVYGQDKGAKFAWKVLANGLIYSANRIPEISDTVIEIDNAMKWGYNFEMGPFETWDAIGVKESVEKMEKEGFIEKMEKEGFTVPEKVKKMLAAGNKSFYKTENGNLCFYDFASASYKAVKVSENVISLNILKRADKVAKSCGSASLVDLGDGVFCCEFHTKMNAINKEIVEFMGEGIDYVDANGAGLVIGNQAGGMPGAFSAGGDLFYMGTLAQMGKFAEINSFLKTAHCGNQQLFENRSGRNAESQIFELSRSGCALRNGSWRGMRSLSRSRRPDCGSCRTLYGIGGNRRGTVACGRRMSQSLEEIHQFCAGRSERL